ncbi:MAG: hypothetical protein JO043_06185 [Candidatus Eremiobacteraeota bacterium]|nr:hypothetical protein [Candidatus Eremiobacteraeota bacterium]
MMLSRIRTLAVSAALAAGICLPSVAGAMKVGVFDGVVTHVSMNNIKARSSNGQELSFLILPRFNKIFKANGTTSVQMKDIKAGNYVRIYYDQSALGARHADRILVDRYPLKPMKS